MSVTLLEVWRAARARSVPFSGESAGFAALSLCEATQHSPRSLALTDAELGEDGSVRLLSNRACSQQQADKDIRTLLGRLLEVSSSPGPSLFRVAGRGGGTAVPLLADEIEKALIPLNRAAARRALVRLHRETARAVEQGKLAPAPDLGEPAQIRLSPPPPPVAPSEGAAPRVHVANGAPPPPVVEKLEVRARSESPPPLPVASPIPLVVMCETPPPVAIAREPVAPLQLASREPTLPLKMPLIPASAEPEHLTSPETVVARRARGMVSPPPLPSTAARSESTPPMGSVDVAVIGVSPALPVLVDSPADATERVPPVSEDEAESLDALASWPLSSPRAATHAFAPVEVELELEPDVEPEPSRSVPGVEPRSETAMSSSAPACVADDASLSVPLPRFELSAELSPDPPTAEPPALRESPALVVGVHVADSDEHAEQVADDELETRPLPSTVEAAVVEAPPVEPMRPILAPQSDVRELLSDFKVQEGLSETELRRELKALAGVDLTPGTALNVGPR